MSIGVNSIHQMKQMVPTNMSQNEKPRQVISENMNQDAQRTAVQEMERSVNKDLGTYFDQKV